MCLASLEVLVAITPGTIWRPRRWAAKALVSSIPFELRTSPSRLVAWRTRTILMTRLTVAELEDGAGMESSCKWELRVMERTGIWDRGAAAAQPSRTRIVRSWSFWRSPYPQLIDKVRDIVGPSTRPSLGPCSVFSAGSGSRLCGSLGSSRPDGGNRSCGAASSKAERAVGRSEAAQINRAALRKAR